MNRQPRDRNRRRPLSLDMLEGRELLAASMTTGGSVLHQAAVPAVKVLYQNLLQRAPDPTGLDGFALALQGGNSIAEATDVIVTSKEFIGNNITDGATPIANQTQFVTALYNDVLGRPPGPTEVTPWVNAISSNTMTIQQVALAFVASPEAKTST